MKCLLAPLRGVTIRCFRETFLGEIVAAGFDEAVTPFIPAIAGYDPLRDRELRGAGDQLPVTVQFIGKDPRVFEECLKRIRDAGFRTADLNCGCPYPMVRNKGRGSGLLRTGDVLERMLETGCRVMGENSFSVKTRLGIDRADELEALMPVFNRYPLRHLTVHGRIARQMYEGKSDLAAVQRIAALARMPVVLNGDLEVGSAVPPAFAGVMIGRAFVRSLGARADAPELLRRYAEASLRELHHDRAVLGRLKELLSYWRELPGWQRRWRYLKLARTVEEILA